MKKKIFVNLYKKKLSLKNYLNTTLFTEATLYYYLNSISCDILDNGVAML